MLFEPYRIEVRPGWVRDCPYCRAGIRFTKLVNATLTPFFYSDASNDVLLRDSDIKRVQNLIARAEPRTEELAALWQAILTTAPSPPGGGRFMLWSNIRCPHCNKPFPYNNGILDMNMRIHEPFVVLIDGAVVVGDDIGESWRVSVSIG